MAENEGHPLISAISGALKANADLGGLLARDPESGEPAVYSAAVKQTRIGRVVDVRCEREAGGWRVSVGDRAAVDLRLPVLLKEQNEAEAVMLLICDLIRIYRPEVVPIWETVK